MGTPSGSSPGEGPRVLVLDGVRYRFEWSDIPGILSIENDTSVGLAIATERLALSANIP